jgi:hypothetical protein
MKTKSDRVKIIGFALLLIVLLIPAAWIQVSIFSFKMFENLFLEAYLFNGSFAWLSYILLRIMNRKKPELTGFIFMGGSALKFLLFLLIFYPTYYIDGGISRMEFASFFVPYALCLTAEGIYFVKS